jgi:hypothetical protein
MLFYAGIVDPCIDPIVIEEEYTIATPIFDDALDNPKREAFVTERIDKRERRDEARFVKIRRGIIIYLTTSHDGFIFEFS